MRIKTLLMLVIAGVVLTACGSSKKFMETYAPEESGLNVMKITDEASTEVYGHSDRAYPGTFTLSTVAGNKKAGMYWTTNHLLAVSPDGSEIAFMTENNRQLNVMIKKSALQGAATQRTFRNVNDFSWGSDGNLYYSDYTNYPNIQLASTDAHVGSLIKQLTSNNIDKNPALTSDGSLLFFTRQDGSGPSIWSLNMYTGALTSCARGYNPSVIHGDNNKFLCVRNSTSGNSEIWLVDYMVGQETLILSDKERSYSNPMISPDGQWILCQGNAKSNITRKQNLDIFAVRIDGTQVMQLTYHPATDCCPVWSADGKHVYFISSRGTRDKSFNVWRMKFM